MRQTLFGLCCAWGVSSLACAEHSTERGRDAAGGVTTYEAGAGASDAGSAPDAWFAQVSEASVAAPETCANNGADGDGDGFTVADGDCNDCDPLINPGAYDFPGNDFDEDCSGAPASRDDDACDQGLDIASTSADDAARAIGLCKFTTEDARDWGVIEARYTTADGSGTLDSPLQAGLLPSFGTVAPRAGSTLLALSSGVARAPGQPGYTAQVSDTFQGAAHAPPAGFPKASSICPATLFDGAQNSVFNQAALELKIRVPTNARSLSFDSIFYSYEYPDYICQPYNDFFVTLLAPAVTQDGNIVFDSQGDPIGVNTGLLAVCDPSTQPVDAPKRFECPQGASLLEGTGFGPGEYTVPGLFGDSRGEGGASTGFITTTAPCAAGSVITLRFAVWDTGDPKLDSTVLIDRFEWSVEQPSAPMTKPTPVLL